MDEGSFGAGSQSFTSLDIRPLVSGVFWQRRWLRRRSDRNHNFVTQKRNEHALKFVGKAW